MKAAQTYYRCHSCAVYQCALQRCGTVLMLWQCQFHFDYGHRCPMYLLLMCKTLPCVGSCILHVQCKLHPVKKRHMIIGHCNCTLKACITINFDWKSQCRLLAPAPWRTATYTVALACMTVFAMLVPHCEDNTSFRDILTTNWLAWHFAVYDSKPKRIELF